MIYLCNDVVGIHSLQPLEFRKEYSILPRPPHIALWVVILIALSFSIDPRNAKVAVSKSDRRRQYLQHSSSECVLRMLDAAP
jgi:hypothetical protein